MHGLAVYVKEGLSFAHDLSLENSVDSYYVFNQFYFAECLTSFAATACAAPIVHRNPPFCLYQQSKSSESKVKSRQVLIVAKGFLKLPNSHMLLKQESIISQKRGSGDFWQIAYSVLNNLSTIPPLFNGFFSGSDKAKFAKNLLRTLTLMTLFSLYLFSLLELI